MRNFIIANLQTSIINITHIATHKISSEVAKY